MTMVIDNDEDDNWEDSRSVRGIFVMDIEFLDFYQMSERHHSRICWRTSVIRAEEKSPDNCFNCKCIQHSNSNAGCIINILQADNMLGWLFRSTHG